MKFTTTFNASCECGKINLSNRRIPKYWSQKKCNECDKKLCVYQNDILMYDFNHIINTATCNCGMMHFTSKNVPDYWSRMKCKQCNTKLTIKDQKKNIIYNFQKKIIPKTSLKPTKIDFNPLIETATNPIKNIFMGFDEFEQFPVHLISEEDINEALDQFPIQQTPEDNVFEQFPMVLLTQQDINDAFAQAEHFSIDLFTQ